MIFLWRKAQQSKMLETALLSVDVCCVIFPYLGKVLSRHFFCLVGLGSAPHIVMANAVLVLSTLFGSFSHCFLLQMNAWVVQE